jgi:hypothetical protein
MPVPELKAAPSYAMVAALPPVITAKPVVVEPSFHCPANDPYVEKIVNGLIRNARPAKNQPIPACWMLLQHVWPSTQKMINGIHTNARNPAGPYFSAKVLLQRDAGDYGVIPMFVTIHIHVRTRLDGFFVATHASIRTMNNGTVHDQGISFQQPIAYSGA